MWLPINIARQYLACEDQNSLQKKLVVQVLIRRRVINGNYNIGTVHLTTGNGTCSTNYPSEPGADDLLGTEVVSEIGVFSL